MTKKMLLIGTMLLATTVSAWGGTFLIFSEANPALLNFVLTNVGGTSNTLTAGGAINYQFAVVNPLGTNFRSGNLSFSASSTATATGPDGAGDLNELGWTGSGSITDPLAVSGSNPTGIVFTWSFGPLASIKVKNGGTGGTFLDSLPPAGEIVYSSPYITFSPLITASFSFGLSGGTPFGSIGPGGRLGNEAFSGVATFDATPLPTGTPEPATMAMLGSALIGLSVFGRKRFARR